MSRTVDDPIFDPWTAEHSEEEREDPRPPEPGARWASPSGSQGVPAPRPVPVRRDPPAQKPPTPRAGAPDAPEPKPATPAAGAPTPREPKPVTRSAAAPPPPASPRARRLHETVLPRLEWLSREVEAAGHRTVLDDRLDSSDPSLRFRLTRRRGPFEDPGPGTGAVIEIASSADAPLRIVGRLWLDPLSPRPTEEVRVPAPKLTEAWIDRLLLDFVEKALEQK